MPAKKAEKTEFVYLTMRITKADHDQFKILAIKKSMTMTELFKVWLEKACK